MPSAYDFLGLGSQPINLGGTGDWLAGILNPFMNNAGLPSGYNTPWANDPMYNSMFGLIKDATDPNKTNALFDAAMSNLRRQQGGAVGSAQAAAGARAASGNLLNRGNFVNAVGSQARAPYADATGRLEEARAKALASLSGQGFDMMALLQRAISGDQQAKDELALRRASLEEQKRQFNAANETSLLDWLGLGLGTAGKLGSSEAFLKMIGLL